MFGNLKELPKPVGEYTVGITEMNFEDLNRKGVFPVDKGAPREIPATIFYPAESDEGKANAPYAFPEAFEILKKMSFGLFSKTMLDVKTHCYPDVDVSKKMEKYPVILFNHGYSSFTTQSTVLCADLASSGYVVVSIGHPHESGAVRYLDGRVIKMDKTFLEKLTKGTSGTVRRKLMRIVKEKNLSDLEAMQTARLYYNVVPDSLMNNVQVWVDDSAFIADQMEIVNAGDIPSIFKGKLDLEKGVGLTGHSYGGTTAAQACMQDPRFVCGINIDGGTYGNYFGKDIRKPFMVLASPLLENIGRTTFVHNSEDTYMTLVEKTAHLGYSDALFCARQLNLMNSLGRREKYEFREIITNYHLKFFEKYLLGNDVVKLSDLKYDGIKFRERLKE